MRRSLPCGSGDETVSGSSRVKKSVKDMAASVRERLRQLAVRQNVEFQQILNRYAVERVLYRLSASKYASEFILKGATLFTLWEGFPHRRTRDVDFLGFGESSAERLRQMIEEILATTVTADGLVFGAVEVAPIREEQEYGGLRVSTQAALGNAKIPLTIDVGFGDDVVPAPTLEEFPTLLDLPKPRIRVYPVETVIAEKLEAMVILGMANSRMKDFFDLWHLTRLRSFDGNRLATAVMATFKRRKTPIPEETPLALTPQFADDSTKQMQWTAFNRRSVSSETPPALQQVIERLREFLLPVLNSIRAQESFSATWPVGDSWRYQQTKSNQIASSEKKSGERGS